MYALPIEHVDDITISNKHYIYCKLLDFDQSQDTGTGHVIFISRHGDGSRYIHIKTRGRVTLYSYQDTGTGHVIFISRHGDGSRYIHIKTRGRVTLYSYQDTGTGHVIFISRHGDGSRYIHIRNFTLLTIICK